MLEIASLLFPVGRASWQLTEEGGATLCGVLTDRESVSQQETVHWKHRHKRIRIRWMSHQMIPNHRRGRSFPALMFTALLVLNNTCGALADAVMPNIIILSEAADS